MISISEYITNSFGNEILESFGSKKLMDVFKDHHGKAVMPLYIGNEMQWDRITDSDIEEYSTEEARKLAYKRDSNEYILWVAGDGTLIGRTIGNYMVFNMYQYHGKGDYPTVKSMSMASDKAYVVKDAEKFSTRQLHKERQQARAGALALMNAADVAKENIARYKAILNERKLQEINFGDVVESVQSVTESYAKIIGMINSDMVCTDSFDETIRLLQDLETEYHKIMDVFKRILSEYKSYKNWRKFEMGDMVEYARKEILSGVSTLQNLIDKFNEKYIDDK